MKFERSGAHALLAVLAVLAAAAVARADVPDLVFFQVGNSVGAIQQIKDEDGSIGASVHVETLTASDGSTVVFQLDKIWTKPTVELRDLSDTFVSLNTGLVDDGPVGVPAGPTVAVLVFLPSAQAAGQDYFDIVLGDEKLANQTSVAWTDFHITVETVVGDAGATLSGTPRNLTLLPLYLLHTNGGGTLDFYGGLWPNGPFAPLQTLFTSDPQNDPVKIRVQLGDQASQILLKEWPTVPEPATMALMGLGMLPALLRRRRR
jgi:hypothetical protein